MDERNDSVKGHQKRLSLFSSKLCIFGQLLLFFLW
jgi:hypothetical protein